MADYEALARKGTDAFNRRDEAAARSVLSDDVVTHAPGMPDIRGKDGAIAFDKVWWDACSDAHAEDTHVASRDDYVIVRGIFTGTHDGTLRTPMGDIPATGRRIEGAYVWVFRGAGEHIVEGTILFDRMHVMEQLGLAPQPAAAATA